VNLGYYLIGIPLALSGAVVLVGGALLLWARWTERREDAHWASVEEMLGGDESC